MQNGPVWSARSDERVVHRRLVADVAEVVAAAHRQLVRDLVLHDRLPFHGGAAGVPAVERPRVSGVGGRNQLAEVGVAGGAELVRLE